MSIIVTILCGGLQTRWNNYKGTPKHFAVMNGEILLHRTLKQLENLNLKKENIFVVINEDTDMNYYTTNHFINVNLYKIKTPDNTHTEAYKFLSSEKLWNGQGRTVVLLGDVYFTNEAIETIILDKDTDWKVYGRYGPSNLTKKGGGEMFAHSFYVKHILERKAKLMILDNLYRTIILKRPSGWAWYQLMVDIDPKFHKLNGHFCEINDFTDDIDHPVELDNWNKNFLLQGKK